MASKFLGREFVQKPTCPFCGLRLERPKELQTRMPTEMPVGLCSCGAVFACDLTGHNLGTAMIEALVFGCNGDWDLAWGLLPEEDYQEDKVEKYDLQTHRIIPGGVHQGRRIAGTLYFVKLHQDVREVTEEGARKRFERAGPVAGLAAGKSAAAARKSLSKNEVEALVQEYKVEPLLEVAGQDKRMIRNLHRLIYSVDKKLRWRAAEVLGKVCALIAGNDPGSVSKLLQRLFTAISDTAASSWGSLDAIGEIISHSPDLFAGYAPQVYQFAGDRALLAEVLRALGKIAAESPAWLRRKAFNFIPLLQDPDSEIRGNAALLLGNLGAEEARAELLKLKADAAEIDTYQEGELETKTIGRLAVEALGKLSAAEVA